MRKLITIIVVSLVPVGLWTAGCRQNNRQATFPNSSEMKGLAKADTSNKNKPPHIGPAPIDRDILNLPDSPAVARATAVQDRSKKMTGSQPPEDLFTLPEPSSGLASVFDSRPEENNPANNRREFWSQPAAAPTGSRYSPAPDGVSAMAPANSGAMAPPVQYSPPASRKQSRKLPEYSDPMDVPGLFMGEPLSYRNSGPPTARQTLSKSYPGGDALGAPPPLTKREFTTEFENTAKRTPASENPGKLDISGLLNSSFSEPGHTPPASRANPFSEDQNYSSAWNNSRNATTWPDSPPMIVHAIPGDYEPLPEPIPLEQYIAMLDEKPIAMTPRSRNTYMAPTPVALPKPETARLDNALSFLNNPPREPANQIPARKKTLQALPATHEPDPPAGMILPLPHRAALPGNQADRKQENSLYGIPKLPVEKSTAASTAEKVQVADIKKALAPLPDISGGASARKKTNVPFDDMTGNIPLSQPVPLSIPSLEQSGIGKPEDRKTTQLPEISVEDKKIASLPTTSKTTRDTKKKVQKPKRETKQDMPLGIAPGAISALPSLKRDIASGKPDPLGVTSDIQELQRQTDLSAKQPEPLSLPELPALSPEPPMWVEATPSPASPSKKEQPDAEAFASIFLESLKSEPAFDEPFSAMAEPKPPASSDPAPTGREPPKKITLQPIRKHRDGKIATIDSQTDVPPMRF